jgi:hypothetical protein
MERPNEVTETGVSKCKEQFMNRSVTIPQNEEISDALPIERCISFSVSTLL